MNWETGTESVLGFRVPAGRRAGVRYGPPEGASSSHAGSTSTMSGKTPVEQSGKSQISNPESLHVRHDDLARPGARHLVLAEVRRQQERVPGRERRLQLQLLAVVERALPPRAREDLEPRPVRLLLDPLALQLHGLHRELLALDEEQAAVREPRHPRGLVLRDAHRVEVRHAHRLLDVERTRLAV